MKTFQPGDTVKLMNPPLTTKFVIKQKIEGKISFINKFDEETICEGEYIIESDPVGLIYVVHSAHIEKL